MSENNAFEKTRSQTDNDMSVKDYARAARRTMNDGLTWEQMRIHALHGLSAEVGEIHSIFQKSFQGHAVSRERILDEMGDLAWFWFELAYAIAIDPVDILENNIKKLKKRYPEGFDPSRSVNRE